MKQCTKCKETKSYTDFYKNRSNKDGYEYYCKPCKNAEKAKNKEVDKRYYQKNREERIKKARIYELTNMEQTVIKRSTSP